ncbi:MAG: phosphopentomutase [Candidatus Eremiobacteraeota bacterium]|nr:phosphopentomutase [Candidatus Eremiobacteraeota bacterium]MBC5828233.1 phosphopentomutase [Candidatus Eremiobacteraeota bacterium]
MSRPSVIVLVIDSGGIGALRDAARFGDAESANTIGNALVAARTSALPNLAKLGLGLLVPGVGLDAPATPMASWGRLCELSEGKDTITGHWEMMGIVIRNAFPTYPRGFPAEVVERFEAAIGRPVLGNKTASGTVIIEELGAEHMRTGKPILYTSADSVFQVAAHETVVPLETLWNWCALAREMLVPPHRVNRVIARPFAGEPGSFTRTAGRRDFAVAPPSPSVLDLLVRAGVPTCGLGKIQDIYCCQGIAAGARTATNAEGIAKTIEWLDRGEGGFCFTNLNDFDSKYGHRRDADGYAKALIALDARLPDILNRLQLGDRLLITADHGCDPTAPGSDHTREFAPLLDYRPRQIGVGLGELEAFAQVGSRVMQSFGLAPPAHPLEV